MNKLSLRLALGAALVVTIGTVAWSARAADDDDKKAIKEAQAALVGMADDLAAGKSVGPKAEALKKKVDELGIIMAVFKPAAKGGLGASAKGDSIEAKLNSIGGPKGVASTDKKEDLIKMGYATAAVAEVAKLYAPSKPKAGKGAKEWKELSDDQAKASQEFIKAIQAGNKAAAKKAATNVTKACNQCHEWFRD
jgi:soluble cytochrome b562